MKKLLLISILLGSIILAGCSTSSTKVTENKLFEKKQECSNQSDKMIQDAQKFYGDGAKYLEIKEIFYSPKLESCMYIVQYSLTSPENIRDNQAVEIFDHFSKKFIDGINTPYDGYPLYLAMSENKCNDEIKSECIRLADKIKELKGE